MPQRVGAGASTAINEMVLPEASAGGANWQVAAGFRPAMNFPEQTPFDPVGAYEDAPDPRDESLKTAATRTKAAGMVVRWKR